MFNFSQNINTKNKSTNNIKGFHSEKNIILNYSIDKSSSHNSKNKNINKVNKNNFNKNYYSQKLNILGKNKKEILDNKLKKIKKNLMLKQIKECNFKPKKLNVKVISIQSFNKSTNSNIKSIKKKNNNLQLSFSSYNMNNNYLYNKDVYSLTKYCHTSLNLLNKNNNNNSIKKHKKITKTEIINKSNKLYNDSKTLKKKHKKKVDEYYKKNYPFKPRISKSQETFPAKNYFFFRLQNWILKHCMNQIRLEENTLIDNKTGIKFFSPQLISNYKSNIDLLNKSHSNKKKNNSKRYLNLYEDSKIRIDKYNQIKTDNNNYFYKLSNSTFFSPRSKEIINKLTLKLLKKIFEIISQKGNYISKNNIYLDEVPDKILLIFEPLLKELNMTEEKLNEIDFFESCIDLFQKMDLLSKNTLIEWYFQRIKKENLLKKENIKNLYDNVLDKEIVNKKCNINIDNNKIIKLNNYLSSRYNSNNFENRKKYKNKNRNYSCCLLKNKYK